MPPLPPVMVTEPAWIEVEAPVVLIAPDPNAVKLIVLVLALPNVPPIEMLPLLAVVARVIAVGPAIAEFVVIVSVELSVKELGPGVAVVIVPLRASVTGAAPLLFTTTVPVHELAIIRLAVSTEMGAGKGLFRVMLPELLLKLTVVPVTIEAFSDIFPAEFKVKVPLLMLSMLRVEFPILLTLTVLRPVEKNPLEQIRVWVFSASGALGPPIVGANSVTEGPVMVAAVLVIDPAAARPILPLPLKVRLSSIETFPFPEMSVSCPAKVVPE